jgi:AAA+ ATPase superfamily predicted ATPase
MTVVTGRRRIGKTSLILKATADSPTVYLFIGRKPKKLQTGIVGYKGSSTKTKSAYEV